MFKCDFNSICQIVVNRLLDEKIEYNGKMVPRRWALKYNEDCSFTKPCVIVPIYIRAWNTYLNKVIYTECIMIFTGNTSVFFVKLDEDILNLNELLNKIKDDFKNTSNHDTCWITDGFIPLDEIYFQILNEVNPPKENENGRQFSEFEYTIEASFIKFPKIGEITLKPKEDHGYKIVKISV